MKRIIFFAALALMGTVGWAMGAYEHGFAHGLGIDTQQSQFYDFVSGVGPMLVTSLGYGGLIAAVVGKFNCHYSGCWRIGKHHVGGSPWCGKHHDLARPERSEHELLEQILDALNHQSMLLRAMAGMPGPGEEQAGR